MAAPIVSRPTLPPTIAVCHHAPCHSPRLHVNPVGASRTRWPPIAAPPLVPSLSVLTGRRRRGWASEAPHDDDVELLRRATAVHGVQRREMVTPVAQATHRHASPWTPRCKNCTK